MRVLLRENLGEGFVIDDARKAVDVDWSQMPPSNAEVATPVLYAVVDAPNVQSVGSHLSAGLVVKDGSGAVSFDAANFASDTVFTIVFAKRCGIEVSGFSEMFIFTRLGLRPLADTMKFNRGQRYVVAVDVDVSGADKRLVLVAL